MGYTVNDANSELRKIISGDNPASKEELQRIINKLKNRGSGERNRISKLIYQYLI